MFLVGVALFGLLVVVLMNRSVRDYVVVREDKDNGFEVRRNNRRAWVEVTDQDKYREHLWRVTAPFREYPWNQVGVNGQVLSVDDDMSSWVLKDQHGNIIDSGNSLSDT